MKNEKLEIIESNEFQNLFDKSKKLIDSARSNMGQMANAITREYDKMCAIRQEYDKFKWCNQHKYVIMIMLEHRKRLY